MNYRRSIDRWATVLGLFALLLSPSLALGQDPVVADQSFTITGTVTDADDGTPLQYAVVGVPEFGSWVISEADGSFELEMAAPGLFRILVVKRGWYLADQAVSFAGPDELEINLTKERGGDEVGPGRLVGRVREMGSEDPIRNATVRVTPTDQETKTDRLGRFIISGISAGALLVEVERDGYGTLTDTLAAFPGVTIAVEIQLSEDGAEAPTVTAEEWPRFMEASGFYRRAERGRGNRFGLNYIQDRNPFSLSDFLRVIPSLREGRGRFGNQVMTTRSPMGGGDRCALAIWVDNSEMPGFGIDSYPIEWVQAIEVYEGYDVPAEFRDDCGVILIWSKGAV